MKKRVQLFQENMQPEKAEISSTKNGASDYTDLTAAILQAFLHGDSVKPDDPFNLDIE